MPKTENVISYQRDIERFLPSEEMIQSRMDFSRRQAQVIYWTMRGKTGSEIGAILGLSPQTVETYITRIYEKLQVSSRVGALLIVAYNCLEKHDNV